jgi:hypothetical protein
MGCRFAYPVRSFKDTLPFEFKKIVPRASSPACLARPIRRPTPGFSILTIVDHATDSSLERFFRRRK